MTTQLLTPEITATEADGWSARPADGSLRGQLLSAALAVMAGEADAARRLEKLALATGAGWPTLSELRCFYVPKSSSLRFPLL